MLELLEEYFMGLAVNNKNEIILKTQPVWVAGLVSDSSWSWMSAPIIEAGNDHGNNTLDLFMVSFF